MKLKNDQLASVRESLASYKNGCGCRKSGAQRHVTADGRHGRQSCQPDSQILLQPKFNKMALPFDMDIFSLQVFTEIVRSFSRANSAIGSSPHQRRVCSVWRAANMKFDTNRLWKTICLITIAMLGHTSAARADVGPPVGISLISKDVVASTGLVYEGEIEIRVHRSGELSDIQIAGDGWVIKTSTMPTQAQQVQKGNMRVKFQATPTDPDSPLALSLRYNGRMVKRVFEVGPAHADLKLQQRPLLQIPNTSGLRPGQTVPVEVPQESVLKSSGGAVPIQVVGRVVYDRIGMDRSNPLDGDTNDPEDIVPATVGADTMRVQLLDKDPFGFEIIWTGTTDENGYFDSGTVWWDDCDISGCDDPDYVLRVAAFSPDAVLVQDSDDETYDYFQPERLNSSETFIDYGVLRPDAGHDPVIHILNTVVRAKRFTEEEVGIPAGGVLVFWPDDSKGGGAWYVESEITIHISTQRQWRTDTILHEYGHHHNSHFYGAQRPDPSYCDPEMDCDTDPVNNVCGHCIWCDENPVDAWFEGWANWFADVVTRHYPERYTNEDGTPFEPLFTRSQESPQPCGGGSYGNRISTEGFVGALLRDIEDNTQDDHDDDPDSNNVVTDGVFDSLCIGAGKVVFLTYAYDPINVTQFLAGYLDAFPAETHLLWPTAFNVGGSAYVSMFPADTQPPGDVTVLDSPSHPLGQGGGMACMTFAFEPPDDDVQGSNFYSYVVSDDPAGVEPDEGADPVNPGANCGIEFTVPIYQLGEYYVNIKAQDNDGNWSSQWSTFGPFEVLDCNNSGQLDICDIDCRVTSIPGLCNFGISPCGSVFSCTENAQDCNGNWEPDICDVTSLRSEDCDINGVPDECQSMKHYTGGKGNPDQNKWEEPENWEELSIPVNGNYVCVPADSDGNAVVYKQDDTIVSSIASYKDFVISGLQSPFPDLDLLYNSFVLGDFQMDGNSTLTINDRLYVDGTFFWLGGSINGNGIIEVSDGMSLTPSSVNLNSADFLLRNGDVDTGTLVNINSGATFQIDPNANYNYSGDYYFFYGSNGKVIVRGNLTREAGNATATVFTPLDNEGTIHVKAGELFLAYPGTHSGQFDGDLGTSLKFSAGNGVHDFLPSSSITAPVVEFFGGTGNIHGTVNITDMLLGHGGTYTFASDATIVDYSPELHVNLGKVVFDAPTDRAISFDTVALTNPGQSQGRIDFNTGFPVNIGTFSMLKGALAGSSPVNVSGTFTWTNGSFFDGGAITANGPVVINATSSSRTLSRVLNVNDQANVFSGFGMSGSAAINIINSAIVNLQFNSGGISGRTINNFGTILRTSGTGNASLGSFLNNTGFIHNQTATLTLNGGGTHTGDVRSEPGTLLKLGGTTDFLPGSTLVAESVELLSGTGTMRGSVNISDTMSVTGHAWTFTDEADIINYGPHLNVVLGKVTFEGPTDAPMAFDTVTIGPGNSSCLVYFNSGQPVNINTLTMNNSAGLYGTSPITIADQFTWSWGSINAGGAMRCDGNTTVNPTSSARTLYRPLNNYGAMTVRGTFSLAPSGPINNMPSGVMDIQFENGGIGITGVINNEGTMIKSTTAGVAGLPNLVNTGTVDVQVGGISFHTSYVGYTQTAGETILNNSSVEMLFGHKPFKLQGGLLKGNGSVVGEIENSGGTVTPGFSVGEIMVDDYTQGAGGVLEIEIGGANAGEFDVLTVTGSATLAGELRITDLAGFNPQSGDTFVIMTATSISGTFDTENMPNHYTVAYNATDVTIQGFTPSPDLNGDGVVDLKDFALFQTCYSGAGQLPNANCAAGVNADLDMDNDVDFDDYLILFAAFTP